MKVKAIGKMHMLLILSATEAQLLGIPTENSCAMILCTHSVFYPQPSPQHKRYRVQPSPQVFLLESCTAMLNLLERFCHLPFSFPCRLFSIDNRYAIIFYPSCRHFFLLRSLAGEYGTLLGKSSHLAASVQEHGVCLSMDAIKDFRCHLRK